VGNEQREPGPVVDAHLHVWDPALASYPWLVGGPPVVNRAFALDDVVPDLEAAGVDSVVLVQSADDVADTELMLECARKGERVAGVNRNHTRCIPSQAATARGTGHAVRPEIHPAQSVEHRSGRRVPRPHDVLAHVPESIRDDAGRLAPCALQPGSASVILEQKMPHARQETPRR
jgi:predicted TIM-barrel fold metal-dependent hydrolase